MHEGRRPSCISFHLKAAEPARALIRDAFRELVESDAEKLEARAGGARAGAGPAAWTGGHPSAGGSKGKDFGQWAWGWNRQVVRGAGLRYTRAKDLV